VERFGLWSVFHKHFVVELFTYLRDELGDEYWIDIESEILLVPQPSGPARPVSPDVTIAQACNSLSSGSSTSGVTPALLEVDEAIGEFEQNWIEIRRRDWPDPGDSRGARVVAVLELLSPSNKGLFGERDFRKFVAKRRDYLLSTVSYTEVDVLMLGTRELPPAVNKVSTYAFFAWSSQVRERTRHHWVWGWNEDQPVPIITLPLDYPRLCPLDLAGCYQLAYETNHWLGRLSAIEGRQRPSSSQ
jgi:hypothetical protein